MIPSLPRTVEMTEQKRAVWGHVAPFALWLGVMFVAQGLEWAGACPRWLLPWSYAVKSAACAALFLALKPWKFYPHVAGAPLREAALAVAAGTLVAAVWVAPELPAVGRAWPGFQEFYYRWLVMMPGSLPDYYEPSLFPALPPGHASLAYSPEEAGWGLTLAKLAGSSLVIAVVEEFFFRGFLYRWLRRGRFWEVPLTAFDAQAFWTVVGVFGLEHDRWFAGLAAGAVYGWLAVRTGDIRAACLAHGLTNFLLGVYVVASGQYGFW